jgi:metal-responsive CopG/Arc/MetJ family transcriptional regulator
MREKVTKRIILDFSPEVMDEIDILKDTLGVKSRAELIRYALGLLDLTMEKRQDGFAMQFRKGEQVVDVAMPILG